MSKNIFDNIAEELLRGVDLNGVSEKEKDKLSEEIMDNLYYRIILKSIESVDESEKNNLINDLQNVKDDANAVMDTIQRYVPNMEEVVAQIMGEYRKELEINTISK